MPPVGRLSAYVLFCDNVRQEFGDKRTFVGVYGTELSVPDLPMLLPTFHVVTSLICYRREAPKHLVVRLNFADEEVGKQEVTGKELEEWIQSFDDQLSQEESEFPLDDPPKLRLTVEIFISPFVIEREGRLSAHIDTDTGTVRAGSIKIVQKDGVESTALPFRRKSSKRD